MKNIRIITVFAFLYLLIVVMPVMASDYTVQQGDSLWKIAAQQGTSVDKIRELNNLTSDLLSIGQVLKLTTTESIAANNIPVAPVSVPPAANDMAATTYIVQAGDSLWSIAVNHRTTVDAIKSLNNLTDEFLQVGQTLNIKGTAINPNVSRSGEATNGRRVITLAANYLGVPYKYGGTSPSGFDCSGFVQYVFKQVKINLPRTAAGQYQVGTAVDKQSLQSGDLVFFKRNGAANIDHVGIYTGNGNFIHSSSPRSGGVIYSSIYDKGYYQNYYVGAKRIIN